MAEKDGMVLTADERKMVVKALDVLENTRQRSLNKEENPEIQDALSREIRAINNLAARFR